MPKGEAWRGARCRLGDLVLQDSGERRAAVSTGFGYNQVLGDLWTTQWSDDKNRKMDSGFSSQLLLLRGPSLPSENRIEENNVR